MLLTEFAPGDRPEALVLVARLKSVGGARAGIVYTLEGLFAGRATAVTQVIGRQSPGDRIQPGFEGAAVIVMLQVLAYPDEGVLEEVLRITVPADAALQESDQRHLPASDKGFHGGGVTGTHEACQRLIIGR